MSGQVEIDNTPLSVQIDGVPLDVEIQNDPLPVEIDYPLPVTIER